MQRESWGLGHRFRIAPARAWGFHQPAASSHAAVTTKMRPSLAPLKTNAAGCITICHVRNTISIRVPKALGDWLQQKSRRTGISQGQIVREQLERVRHTDKGTKKFMRLAGAAKNGPRNLSTSKGFCDR